MKKQSKIVGLKEDLFEPLQDPSYMRGSTKVWAGSRFDQSRACSSNVYEATCSMCGRKIYTNQNHKNDVCACFECLMSWLAKAKCQTCQHQVIAVTQFYRLQKPRHGMAWEFACGKTLQVDPKSIKGCEHFYQHDCPGYRARRWYQILYRIVFAKLR